MIKAYLFTLYNRVCTGYTYQNTCIYMVCQNATVKILAISNLVILVVISLAFSKILPEGSAKTEKPTRFDIKIDGKWGNFADSKDQ